MSYETKNIRNIALLGHGNNGKTSLAESMLYVTGAIDRLGKVSDGNTVCDYDAEEIARQITIATSIAPVSYDGCKINVLDCPGFFDFVGDALCALRAVEAGIIFCTAKDGIAVGAGVVIARYYGAKDNEKLQTAVHTTLAFGLTAGIVLKLAALYFVLRIIDGAASYYMSSIGHIMGVHIETDMRRDAFDHLLQLDHTYYNNTKVGTIMGRITNDLFDVTEFAHHCPEEFFIAGIKIVASFVILCRASIPLTLAVFACVPLMGVVSVYLNGRLRARFRQQRVQIGELNSTIEDSLLGQGVVKAFAAEDEEREKFARGNRAFEQIKTLGYYAMGAFNTSTRLFDGLMYLVVILAGGLSLVYGKITAGDLVAYMLYVTTLIATIRRIVEFAEQFQRGMTGIERFAEIMDTPVAIKDAPDAVPLQPGPGEIRFEKVCFEYPDDHNKVLHDVSLDIRAGERLALVGASGGGKTTLCNLIPRFYEVTSGRILIDGQDIRRVTLKSLRQDIGIVQQDVYLFSGTVAQNIAYGKPGATRQEIEAAARLAGAEKFILALKDGYDTYVGERGVKLSGGQKQRIAIARVFLKNPPILILDEATSALDNESEILVGQSLEKLAHGRTTLTIAHRLTTIKDYDRILVLGEEGIVEQGTHAQLLEKQGVYYRLWNQLPAEDGE